MSAAAAGTTVLAQGLRATLAIPDGWQQVAQEPDGEGFAPLVLSPADWPEDFGFRPSIGVLGGPVEEPVASPHLVGSQALAVALSRPDTRVLAYDLWLDGDGRRLVFAYLDDRRTVVVVQHLMVHRGRRLTISASTDSDRYLRVSPALDQALAGLELLEEDG